MSCLVRVHLSYRGCQHDLLVGVAGRVHPRLCVSGGGGFGLAPACGCLERVRNLPDLVRTELQRNLEECLRVGRVAIDVR